MDSLPESISIAAATLFIEQRFREAPHSPSPPFSSPIVGGGGSISAPASHGFLDQDKCFCNVEVNESTHVQGILNYLLGYFDLCNVIHT